MTALLVVALLLMTVLGAGASVFLKQATDRGRLRLMLSHAEFYAGGLLYAVCALLNIWVLRYLDYSLVLPVTSLTYCWSVFLAWLVLGEQPRRRKVIGVALIVLGTFFLVL